MPPSSRSRHAADAALPYLTIAEAAPMLRHGALSPVALVEACLERIDRLDPGLHAYLTVLREPALAAAREAEREIAQGRWRGPLHGIPYAHKDLVCTRGVRTTAHSHSLAGWVPDENAEVHRRLAAAGAVCLGKTALHEFGYGSPGPDEAFPAARNPWNPEHMPGSSSSGSGAAVAAGLCLAATGTDTGGSVRHPAAACGIVGMKPTHGRVSLRGVLPLAPTLDHVGPLTRTVADNALVLQAIAGHDAGDPLGARHPVPDFSAALQAGVHGLRIGVPRRWIDAVPYDDEVRAAFDAALGVLAGLGARIVDVDVPGLVEANDVAARVLAREAWVTHRERLAAQADALGATFRLRVARGAEISEAQYAADLAAAAALRAACAAVFAGGIAALATPGRESAAETLAALRADPARRGLANRPYNLAGLPALTLPMGFGAAGLPLGLQFAGAAFDEATVYRVAAAYEAATPWHRRHPLP